MNEEIKKEATKPAFPNTESSELLDQNGITKLEFFAAKAMQGTLSNAKAMEGLSKTCKTDTEMINQIVHNSFEIAESMIEESLKRK